MLTLESIVDGAPVRLLHQPGAGPRIVLVHGASGSAATWAPVLAALSGREVLAPDLPGRRGSPGAPLEANAGWLSRLLEALGGPPPVLVGHSYGGAVALSLALEAPARVAGLAFVSSGARLRVAPAILEAVAAATEVAPFRLDAAFGEGTPAEVIEAYAAACASTPPATALADWRACDSFDALDRLDHVRVPVRVIYGDADLLTPPKQAVVLAGVGHMLPWESPEGLARALEGWPANG